MLILGFQAGVSCQWVDDSRHLLLEYFDTIQNSPSQIYHSALPFSPSSSWFHKYYTAEFLQEAKVVTGLPTEWGTCSRTVKLGGGPQALACWGDTIAVGSIPTNIIILNAITGSQVAVLSDHDEEVVSLSFSLDGTSLVSGSHDQTLKLWDVQTGGVVKTFCGHTNWVLSVSISYNHTTIASGSSDKTIRLWDIQTGECHCVIEQQGQVHQVAFSPTNPQHLISAGDFVQKWDINGHQVGPAYEVPYATLSPDSTHFTSCRGEVTTVQNSDSGEIVATCHTPGYGPNFGFSYPCFSPNGRLVAVSPKVTILVWDITHPDPLLIGTFIGHTHPVVFLAFSSPSTLISVSLDGSVKFWKISSLPTNTVAGDPESTPPIPASIRSVNLQVENGIAISSDLHGVVRMWDLSTGLCKVSFQTPATYPHWRAAQMIDGRLIFVWLGEREFNIWDAERGELLQMVDINWNSSSGLKISGDGSKVFLHTGQSIQAWSIQTGEAVGEVEVENNLCQNPFDVDGSKIWVHFEDKPTQGWDFGIPGSSPVPLPSTLSNRQHRLHFIHGAYKGDLSRIMDTVTGKVVFQLSGRYADPRDMQWDGQYLVAGYFSGEVLILDFNYLYLRE